MDTLLCGVVLRKCKGFFAAVHASVYFTPDAYSLLISPGLQAI